MTEDFAALVSRLRGLRQWRRRLVVKRVAMKYSGCTRTSDTDKTITITINNSLTWPETVDTLIHEFGHAEEVDEWEPHSEEWGRKLTKYYREWERFNEEQ